MTTYYYERKSRSLTQIARLDCPCHGEKELRRRRKMKTRHRTDDIPRCPSVEDIHNDNVKDINEEEYLISLLDRPPPDEIEYDIRVCPIDGSESKSTVGNMSRNGERERREGASASNSQQVQYYHEHHYYGNGSDIQQIISHESLNRSSRPSIFQNEYVVALFTSITVFLIEQLKSLSLYLARKPKLLVSLLSLIFIYFLFCLYDITLLSLIEPPVRFIWPNLHQLLVFGETWAKTIAGWLTTADRINEAFFCDLSEWMCTRWSSLCDKRCSFMDKELNRLRRNEI